MNIHSVKCASGTDATIWLSQARNGRMSIVAQTASLPTAGKAFLLHLLHILPSIRKRNMLLLLTGDSFFLHQSIKLHLWKPWYRFKIALKNYRMSNCHWSIMIGAALFLCALICILSKEAFHFLAKLFQFTLQTKILFFNKSRFWR